jgi:hypothetical protein
MTADEDHNIESSFKEFRFRTITDTPLSMAMKYALIHPLRSPGSPDFLFDDETVKSAIRKIQNDWRCQVIDLGHEGWSPATGIGLRVAVNCPPTFSTFGIARGSKRASNRACRKYLVCPFCWTRKVVRETFARLEYDLYGTSRSQRLTPYDRGDADVDPLPLDIIEIRRTDIVGTEHTPEELTELAYKSRADFRKGFDKIRGALSLSTIEPVANSWKLTRRFLLVLHKGHGNEIPEESDFLEVRVHKEKLPLEKLAAIVGRVCAYPAGMMRGDPEMVRKILHARRGSRKNSKGNLRGTSKRLMNFYGKLRNKQDRSAQSS